jgi:hypothetical protein
LSFLLCRNAWRSSGVIAGGATRLYDVPHTESSEAGTASLAKLADGPLPARDRPGGRRDAGLLCLDLDELDCDDLHSLRFLEPGETLTTIGDATFGAYQNLGNAEGDFADLFRVETAWATTSGSPRWPRSTSIAPIRRWEHPHPKTITATLTRPGGALDLPIRPCALH